MGRILDRDTLRWHVAPAVARMDVATHERTALGQGLVDMPVCPLHRIKDAVAECAVDCPDITE